MTDAGVPGVPATGDAASPSARHVLVVDDDPEVLATMEKLLRREGHLVTAVTSGREALDCIGERPFDLIISDIRMPDIDGRSLHAEIPGGRRRWRGGCCS